MEYFAFNSTFGEEIRIFCAFISSYIKNIFKIQKQASSIQAYITQQNGKTGKICPCVNLVESYGNRWPLIINAFSCSLKLISQFGGGGGVKTLDSYIEKERIVMKLLGGFQQKTRDIRYMAKGDRRLAILDV